MVFQGFPTSEAVPEQTGLRPIPSLYRGTRVPSPPSFERHTPLPSCDMAVIAPQTEQSQTGSGQSCSEQSGSEQTG
ncbi:MAG: hypothetical protein ABSF33_18660, partial [Acidimicrobiales bacterium]